jgi:threonine dehydrogenase-like Zn-dependent dehydrogenase
MKALVYDAPYQMTVHDVPQPTIAPHEVLVKVAYSGICGSELSGFEGKNSLRKPPLIMGHEFSGTIAEIGQQAAADCPDLQVGTRVTANPLVTCGQCDYCLSGHQQLCPKRKLLSAALPGSNAEYVVITATNVLVLPDNIAMTTASLTEPTACAVHSARLAAPQPNQTALVVGAGPIGLLTIQALAPYGLKAIYCADLNAERLAMVESLGAVPVNLKDWNGSVDIAVDAVGANSTRASCIKFVRSGGRVVWVGLHDAESPLPINDIIRREVACFGSFGYTPLDFKAALQGLASGQYALKSEWTRVEPLNAGKACFEELLKGSSVAKIWLQPGA